MLQETCDTSTKILSPSSAAAAPRHPQRASRGVFKGIFPLSRQLAEALRGEAQVLRGSFPGTKAARPTRPQHLLWQRTAATPMAMGIAASEELPARQPDRAGIPLRPPLRESFAEIGWREVSVFVSGALKASTPPPSRSSHLRTRQGLLRLSLKLPPMNSLLCHVRGVAIESLRGCKPRRHQLCAGRESRGSLTA